MKLSVFSSLDDSPSIERYARELAANFPAGVEVNRVWFPKSRGWKGKVFDKHLKYLRVAKQQQGDFNLVVSEGYAFLLLALEGRRTAVVCHDLHPLIYRGPTPRGFWKARYKFNLRRLRAARFVIAVSEHTRKDLLKYCPFLAPEKVFAVHNGLDASWRVLEDPGRAAGFRRRHGLEGKCFALHVGNDNWYKNFGGLLRALAALPDRELLLVKVGEIGAEHRRLIASLGLESRVRHVPHASSEELLDFYNAAEMLVFPSWHEGFGWPPLEAMACGCPVIASPRASLPEVCGEACLYVQPDDPAAIAAAMQKLLREPALRADLARKGSAQARRFSWKQTAARMVELFQHSSG